MEYEVFVALPERTWPCTIRVLDHSKNSIKASIHYCASEYVLCVTRYYQNKLLGSEFSRFIPADNFVCMISDEDPDYNYAQVAKHTSFEVDRRSEVAALQVILSLFD